MCCTVLPFIIFTQPLIPKSTALQESPRSKRLRSRGRKSNLERISSPAKQSFVVNHLLFWYLRECLFFQFGQHVLAKKSYPVLHKYRLPKRSKSNKISQRYHSFPRVPTSKHIPIFGKPVDRTAYVHNERA